MDDLANERRFCLSLIAFERALFSATVLEDEGERTSEWLLAASLKLIAGSVGVGVLVAMGVNSGDFDCEDFGEW